MLVELVMKWESGLCESLTSSPSAYRPNSSQMPLLNRPSLQPESLGQRYSTLIDIQCASAECALDYMLVLEV